MVKSLDDNKLYAAKRLSKDILQKDIKGFVRIFLTQAALHNEIHLLRNLDHHRVIKFFQIYEEPETIFLIMQLTKGDLMKRLQRQPNISFLEIKLLMTNLLETLVYLRSERIIHRDIKMENLFIRESSSPIFEIIFGDFGFATQYFEDVNSTEIVYHKCGSPGFTAPEVLLFQKGKSLYDAKCDIFSTGVVFHFLFLSL